MLKAVIYARVSTDKQDAGNQFADMQALAARRDYEVVEIYQEQEDCMESRTPGRISAAVKGRKTAAL
jgi:DNA invertase Pin-like site-specific DNA recombinase